MYMWARCIICMLGVTSQESERSCVCVFGVRSQESQRSCICVLAAGVMCVKESEWPGK